MDEGIHDPIVAYEYMHRFYVMEGNKRVSVLKNLRAVKIHAKVTRIIPKKTDELENKIYYEFMDFYEDAQIYDIWFTQEGSFERLTKYYGYRKGEQWSDESRQNLRSEFLSFRKVYKAKGGDRINITSGDAFLAYIDIFPAWQLQTLGEDEIKANLTKMWNEFLTLSQNNSMKIVLEPQKEKSPSGFAIINKFLGTDSSKLLKIAFIYEKSVEDSAWNYAHEMGRMYLEQTFGDKVKTKVYEHAEFTDNPADILEQAISDGNEIIFTIAAQLANASVKAAVEHPEIKILNCSTNSQYWAIRTYYCRMYETKFLLGVIAGALAETNYIGYMADYPIYSTIADINAFALGAQMVNPRVRVHLHWNSVTGKEGASDEWPQDVHLISDKDWIIPEHPTRRYGLYLTDGGAIENIAAGICHWGKLYELIIRSIRENTWKVDDAENKNKALNYWWGISAGVLELVCSKKLPDGTKILIDMLTENIRRGEFSPFDGTWSKQDGTLANEAGNHMQPEEIFKMNYLAGNVVGSIPELEELKEGAKEFVQLQGGF